MPSAALAAAKATPVSALDGEYVVASGEKLWIGELSLDQWSALGQLLIAHVKGLDTAGDAKLKAAVADAKKDGGVPTDAAAAVSWLSGVLNPETAREIVGVIVDRDGVWCGKNLGTRSLVLIIQSVMKHNDRALFAQLFRKAAGGGSSTTSPQPSDEPPVN